MENKDQPANPATIHQVKGNDIETVSFPGLSKREYFTAAALQGMLANPKGAVIHTADKYTSTDIPHFIAALAISCADEILKQFEENP